MAATVRVTPVKWRGPALLWQRLERLRDGPETRSGFIPVRPELFAEVKFFGRNRGGWIRDGVLLRFCQISPISVDKLVEKTVLPATLLIVSEA